MGIWQLFALASILECPIYSVYPNKGNPNVRGDLNRLILPHTPTVSEAVHILWTNHREDIPNKHWVPNHFVSAVPFTKRCLRSTNTTHDVSEPKDDVKIQSQQGKVENSVESPTKMKDDKCLNDVINPEKIIDNQINTDCQENSEKIEGSTTTKTEVDPCRIHEKESNGKDAEVVNKMNTDEANEYGRNSYSKTDEQSSNERPSMNDENNNQMNQSKSTQGKGFSVPGIRELLNKYVFVNSYGRPYPGYVTDIDETEMEISCMHQVGKKRANCFFWPKKLKDISWYKYEQIITIIPEPTPIPKTNHLKVDEKMWEEVSNSLNK